MAGTMRTNKQRLNLSWRYLRALFSRITGEWRTMVEPQVPAEEMEEKIGESLVIEFEVTPVDILHFQSPPEPGTTAETALPENPIER